MARITGRVEVLVNGEPLLNKSGAVASGISSSGFERTEVLGDTGLHGFMEAPIVAQVEVTVTDRDDINLIDILSLDSATVVFRAARSGKAYTMNEAFCTDNTSVTAGEGETPIVFKGSLWKEGTF